MIKSSVMKDLRSQHDYPIYQRDEVKKGIKNSTRKKGATQPLLVERRAGINLIASFPGEINTNRDWNPLRFSNQRIIFKKCHFKARALYR